MKLLKKRQPTVVISVLLALLALWTGGTPLVGSGDSLLGGHQSRWYTYGAGGNGALIGCSADMNCGEHCVLTEWHYCWGATNSSGSLNCTGGAILIAEPQEAGGGLGWGTYLAGCDGLGNCTIIHHAYCDY